MNSIKHKFLLILYSIVLSFLSFRKGKAQRNSVSKFNDAIITSLDIAIVTTLDGNIHGVNKKTGERLWTLDIDQGSMVKSKLYNIPDLNSKKPIKEYEERRTKPKENIKIHNDDKLGDKQIATEYKKGMDDLALRREDIFNEIFIPEPTEDGNIFVMKPGEDLHVLPFSIKALIEQAPFAQNENIYLGSKTTHVLALNPYTGKLIKSYSMESSFGLKSSHDVIHIGRIDYKLIIKDSLTGKVKWNVSYSEYTTANFNEQQAIEYTNKDKAKLELLSASSNAQGDLVVHDKGSGKFVNFKFSSPVISTFGVASKSTNHEENLVLSKAKPIWPKEQLHSSKKAFIGSIDGNLYALSSEKFPNFQATSDDDNEELALESTPNNKLSIYYPKEKFFNEHQNEETKEEEVIEEVGDNEYEKNVVSDYKSKECHYGSPYFPACLLGEQEYYDDYNLILERDNQCDKDDEHSAYQNVIESGKIGYAIYKKISEFLRKVVFTLMICGAIAYSFKNNFISIEKDEKAPIGYRVDVMEKSAIVNHFIKLLQKFNKSQLPTDIDSMDEFSSSLNPSSDSVKYREVGLNGIDTSDDADLLNKIKEVGKLIENNLNNSSSSSVTHEEKPKEEKINESQFPINIGSLVVNEEVLGYGSHGTVVYKGTFQGRKVAVKRLLIDFYDIAAKEVQLLQESDDHPNVIRYFARETTDKFMYIAIELCIASLQDIIEKQHIDVYSKIRAEIKPEKLLYQIISGIQHLHSLKIVHRDIKPQNILIAAPKKNQKHPRVLISDFGLCKKLEDNQSSFNSTIHMGAGTVGWRAPESLLLANINESSGSCDTSSLSHNNSSDNPSSYFQITSSQATADDHPEPIRITKAIDIFSAGCVFFYVLTNGQHPFGDRYYREANIINNKYNLETDFHINIEAKDLIEHMIQADYRKRPSAKAIMSHPYFWSAQQRLNFLQEASDRFEIEQRDPPSPLLQLLETNSRLVVSNDWYKVIDKALLNNLGKYRKYNGQSVRDLLRALRNKKHHYQDLPEYVKEALGPIPDGFLHYFTSRFPFLLLHIYYCVVNTKILRNDPIFASYLSSNPDVDYENI